MSRLSPDDFPWKRSRFGFAVFFHFSLLAASSMLRLVLFLKFGLQERASAGTVAQVVFTGFHQDWFVALAATLPLMLWLSLLRDRTFGQPWNRAVLIGGSFLFWFVQIFLYFTEYYFFDEFKARFNTVAVDYLLYPSEVFGNIRASYPLATVLLVCGAASAIWVLVAFVYFRQMWFQPSTGRSRIMHFAVAALLTGGLWLSLNPQERMLPRLSLNSLSDYVAARTRGAHFSSDRTLNELANNGALSFVNAALTRNLDYAAFYRTLPHDEAVARARRLLKLPHMEFTGDTNSIRRVVAGNPKLPRLNVVLFLEESLGSEFWGSLGRKGPSLTPEMDKLALAEGLLFTNIYACGNRTVRGFEGVLSSFPPLPGDSIVKRDRSENVETLARVLKRDGYSTLFLYGGRGLFDGMRAYTTDNGWDRFIEQKDFPQAHFSTIWGVCDEEVFDRALEEFRGLAATGKPFLGTILSVSNHRPYTYPAGRIPEDPKAQKRSHAVKYSDWCLGQFFAKARKESFWTNTVFVVIADHGARVYGAQNIPIHSYEIPWVILGPAVVPEPQRLGTLGNSLDVAPTILGLIGRPYETMFFGRDLLHDPPEGARAVLNHNRDIGLFSQDRMVILGLQKSVEYYEGDPKAKEMTLTAKATPEFLELEKDATAIYQVADELYMSRRYRIDNTPAIVPASTNAPPKAAP